MVRVQPISRSNLEWTKDRAGEVPRAHRNFDPTMNSMAKETEYTRAVRAAKLDRMFAKPFVSALSGHSDTVQSIATDPSNVSVLVTGAADGGMAVWDVMRKRPKCIVPAHRNAVDGVVVSPDGVACFSASRDKTVRMWDMDVPVDEEVTPVAEYLGESPFTSVDHHLKKPQFVTSGNIVEVWDVNRTKPLQKFEWGDDTVRMCRFNRVEVDLVACCMMDRGVAVYDTRTKSGHSKVILELNCTSVSWSPIDPNHFVAGCDDWNAYLFDMRMPGRPKSVFQGHISAITSIDFSPTGTHFVAGSTDNTVRIWSLKQHTKSDSEDMYHTKRMAKVFSVKWSLDNNYIFSGSEDAIVRVWKSQASVPIRPMRGAEKNQFEYMRTLKDKYSQFIEVKRIANQRNAPKVIKKTRLKAKKLQMREAVKEMSRNKSNKMKPLARRKVVQSLK